MSRYRPPRPESSPYITRSGYEKLSAELTYLWKVKRPEVTRKVSEAAAQGDRSENAEYIYGKKQLREIDSRIGFLSRRLDKLTIVEHLPPDQSRIFFGAWVTLENEASEQHTYRIVGADEFDVAPAYISVDAPLARALIGRTINDEVSIEPQRSSKPARILTQTAEPGTASHYTIINVQYKED
ncbi:MAG: transcription elongation factor GreB [bacterium]